jgi:hypothetical protein
VSLFLIVDARMVEVMAEEENCCKMFDFSPQKQLDSKPG